MKKASITVDFVKEIILGILRQPAVNQLEDGTLLALCGLDHDEAFYTRKHRLTPAKDYLEQFAKTLNRGYCLVELAENSRLFSASLDFAAVQARLTFWVHTKAMPFLDELIERANLDVIGERYPLTDQSGRSLDRSATVSMSTVSIDEIIPHSQIGESAICHVDVSLNITENLAIASDVKLNLTLKTEDAGEPVLFEDVPITKIDFAGTANTRPLTQTNLAALRLSKTADLFALSFNCYCYINDLGKALERLVLAYKAQDNKVLNEIITVKITLPNGTTMTDRMVCTSAKFSGDLTNPCVMSFILNPAAKGGA